MNAYQELLSDIKNRERYICKILDSSEVLRYLYNKYVGVQYVSYPLIISSEDYILIEEPWWIDFLCICNGNDCAVVEKSGFIRVIRFYKNQHLPSLGDMEIREGNFETTLGEGLYCYLIENPLAHIFLKNRTAVILEGNVKYWECIGYNDENEKIGEILILKEYPIKVKHICNTQKELDIYLNHYLDN